MAADLSAQQRFIFSALSRRDFVVAYISKTGIMNIVMIDVHASLERALGPALVICVLARIAAV